MRKPTTDGSIVISPVTSKRPPRSEWRAIMDRMAAAGEIDLDAEREEWKDWDGTVGDGLNEIQD